MIIGPGVSINGGVNFVVAQDQFYPNNALLVSYGPNVAPAGTAQSFTQDASPNNFGLIINGDARPDSFMPFQPNGYWSNYFDGTGDYLTVASNVATTLDANFTIEFWVYTGVGNNWFFSLGDTFTTSGIEVYIGSSGTLFNLYSNGASRISSATLPTPNAWSHIAAVRSGTTITLYLNGNSVGTWTSSATFSGTTYIGAEFYNGSITATFTGYISNFRILKGTALYTANFVPSTVPLSAITNTSLLTCQSNSFIDNSTNNFTITVLGNTAVTVTEPFGWRTSGASVLITNTSALTTGYSSTAFNGSGDYLTNTYQSNPQYNLSSGSWTIEAWVFKTSSAAGTIVNLINAAGNNSGLNFAIDGSNQLTQNNGVTGTTAAGTVTLNTWTHVAAVCNGTNTQLYINGTAAGSPITQLPNTAQFIVVGANGVVAQQNFPGYISNLRIVRGVAVYTGSFTPSTTPLGLSQSAGTNTAAINQGQTIFLLNGNTGGNNINFIDGSANNFAITRNGDVAQGPFSPYYSGYYSNYFDGNGDYLTTPSIALSTTDFTWEAWLYRTATKSIETVFVYPANNGLSINFETSGTQITLGRYGIAYIAQISTTVPLNQWFHLAVSKSSNVYRVFVNGTQIGTTYTDATAIAAGAYNIGADSVVASREITGYISNLRLVIGSVLYTSNFTPSTIPLTAIANTALLTCQSNRFIDNSVYGYSITRSGDVTVRNWQPFALSYTASQGGSAYFDGSGDYLTVSGNPAFEFGTGNMTMEAYVYRTVSSSVDTILQYGRATVSNYDGISWALYISSSNFATFEMSNGVSAPIIAPTSSVLFPTNAWTHLALVRSGNNFTLYQNGVSVATASTSSAFYIPSSSLFWVARNHDAGTGDMAGYISDVRIVKGTAVYTTNFTPPTAPLTAITNTSLLCNLNNFNTYDLTLSTTLTGVGSTGQNTRIPFALPTVGVPYSSISTFGSGYFDGSGDYLTVGTTSSFNFLHNSTALFTIEGWVYCPSFASSVVIFGTNAGASAEIGAAVWINSSAQLVLLIGRGSAGNPVINATSTGTVPLNQWVHVAVTYNQSLGSSNCTFYINGAVAGTANKTGNAPSASNSTYPGTINGFGTTSGGACYLSNIRVNNSIIYTASFIPPTTPLTSITSTRLLTLQQDGPANNTGFIDSGPNALLMSRTGNATQGSFNPYWPTGYWSTRFNGSTDNLNIAASSAFNIATSTTPFTVEKWIYPTATGGCTFSEQWTGGANTIVIAISMTDGTNVQTTSGRTIAFGWYSGSAWTTAAMASAQVSLNAWTHVACVFTGSTSRIYYNGVDVTKSSSPTPATTWGVTGTNGDGWYIGRRWDGGSPSFFNGLISNFRLTIGTAIYTAAFTPPSAPLTAIANTALLTLQNPRFIDNSGRNGSITTSSTPITQPLAPFSPLAPYTPAVYGGSAYLDGTGDSISSISNPIMNFGTGNFTVECWIYPTVLSGNRVIAERWASSSGWQLYWRPIGSSITWYVNAAIFLQDPSSTSIVAGTWSHVAVSRSGTTTRMFVNGVLVTSATDTNNYTFSQPLSIGRQQSTGTNDFLGYITDFRMSSAALYTASFTPPTTPLTATSSTITLINSQNAAIYDRKNLNDIETIGNTQTLTSVRNLGAGCMYFDGSVDGLALPYSSGLVFGTGNFTIEFWLNFASISGYQTIYSFGYAVAGGFLLQTGNGDGKITVWAGATPTVVATDVGSTVNTNQWYYMAIVRNGSTTTIYRNGVNVGSGTDSNNYNPATTTPIYVGGGSSTGFNNFYFNGYMDNLQVTPGIAKYTANFSVPTSNPIYQ